MTREYLHTTAHELGVANQELLSSNEELRSTNQQLQTANEELESSKEELHSANEELAAVNAELRQRIAQLDLADDDLQTLSSAASIAFVIVDMQLHVRRFSRLAEQWLGLVPADFGRPISFLAPELASMSSESINRVRECTQQVRIANGRSYVARVVPCCGAQRVLHGAFIEFLRTPVAAPQEGGRA